MTKCMRKEVNLKSSTYNQTGQSYFQQFAAYNSMSLHLRRILSAKSVVDSRNKKYLLKKNQRCKVQETRDERFSLRPEVIDDVIDRLAYDTLHHPMDILRMSSNSEHLDCCNYNSGRQQLRVCSDRKYCEENDRMDHRLTLTNRRMASPATTRSSKRKKFTPNSVRAKKELKSMREVPHVIGPSTCYSQQRKGRYGKDSFFVPCTTTTLDSVFKTGSHSLMQETNDHHSVSSNVSQCDFDYLHDDQSVKSNKLVSKQLLSQKEEEKKYVKFIYDITKEIIQKGLYTDNELRNVFKKHIDRYKGILNMSKMLYEIYQLKISLNMMDEDSDTDDELEDLIHAQQLLSGLEIRPPTPPKVLNENKVMEKLEFYRKITDRSRVRRTVTLIDANPDLLVTERDVLMSLVEVGIDPKQVQHICKNLRDKSRDMTQTDAEAYPLDLEVDDSEKSRDDDKQISPKVEMAEDARDSVADDSPSYSEKQEASSSTSNLVSDVQDETVETKEKIESETTLENVENDKVDS